MKKAWQKIISLTLALTFLLGTTGLQSSWVSAQTADKNLKLDKFDLDPVRTSLFPTETTTMRPLATYEDTEDYLKPCIKTQDIPKLTVYTSSNPSYVTVDKEGVIHALKPGSATIKGTITLRGISRTATADITVLDPKNIKSYKTRSTIYTQNKVNMARENVKKYDWAAKEAQDAVLKADVFLAQGPDYLWDLVTAHTLPRSFAVSMDNGSIEMGKAFNDKYGMDGWLLDPIKHPWKVINPDNGLLYPTNDFGAYYKSGLDEHGIFHKELADKSLLKNTLYPEKGEKWGVDDGFGYIDEKGNKYTFIAYYNHWAVWYDLMETKDYPGLIMTALMSLKDAYIYTGDKKYARAGIELLDRVADVYPEFDCTEFKWDDGYPNSHGGTQQGKVLGSIWEPQMVVQWIYAYDAFFPVMDDAEVISYLSEKAKKYKLFNPKNSVAAIRRNIEDNILLQVLPSMKRARLEGNFGMHQSTLAAAAVVLDTMPYTKEMLDFNFKTCDTKWYDDGTFSRTLSGGDISKTLVNCDMIDRNGQGNEGSPHYNALWVDRLKQVADVLDGYDKYPAADLYKNPKFAKLLTSMYPLTLIEKYIPNAGDTGGCGIPRISILLPYCVKAFELYKQPIYAQLAYFLNGNTTNGIHSDIFANKPESICAEITKVISEYGQLNLPSQNIADSGYAILRDGINTAKTFGNLYHFSALVASQSTTVSNIDPIQTVVTYKNDKLKSKISFDFKVAKADTYQIKIDPYRTLTGGIYDIYLDNKLVRGSYDFYGKDGTNLSSDAIASNQKLAAGKHTISFVSTGRNAKNTKAYDLALSNLRLLNQKDIQSQAKAEPAKNTLRDFWVYYGSSNNHGHMGLLHLGVNAFGLDLGPDTGYPEQTGPYPMRMAWDQNTISHNTVVVDKKKQTIEESGTPYHFDSTDRVKLLDVETPKVYDSTSMYRRTTAMIQVDDANSYAVDFFRVKGGDDHVFSFHSYEGTVATEGLKLVSQKGGTYAGENVKYRSDYDGVTNDWTYKGSGFQYLNNVSRDKNTQGKFSVDWNIKDLDGKHNIPEGTHLKLTMLNDVDDVAICDGAPPQGSSGNPENLKYMLAHKSGKNINSIFTSVIEPYQKQSNITSIEQVKVTREDGKPIDEDVCAVKVTLKNGRVDYVVNALDKEVIYIVDGKFRFKGFFGAVSYVKDKVENLYLNDGTIIDKHTTQAALTGKVKSFTKELSFKNEIVITLDKGTTVPNDLVGKYIYIQNDGVRNGAYEILGVKKNAEDTLTLDVGDVTTIRSYVDNYNFAKGYVYNMKAGDKFTIPLSFLNKN